MLFCPCSIITLYICILGISDFRIVDFLYTQDDITCTCTYVQIDSGTYNS